MERNDAFRPLQVFREAGKPARELEIPPPDEEFHDRETLMAIAGKYGQDFIGPPLPPKE